MKHLFTLIPSLFFLVLSVSAQYDEDYVQTYSTNFEYEKYSVVKMTRSGERVKVKYFAGRDFNGSSVYERYTQWARNKKIIAYSSGTYMSDCEPSLANPVGICIDNGKEVNKTLKDFDGLVIVYATGGVVLSNIKEGNLKVTNSDGTPMTLDLKNSFDFSRFKSWAGLNSATVFQTHLLNKDNVIKIKPGSTKLQHRRFMAVGKNPDGEIMYYLVNYDGEQTLYDGTVRVTNFIKKLESLNIYWMINLDRGCQDVLRVNKPDGSVDNKFVGNTPITSAANLIVFYYE